METSINEITINGECYVKKGAVTEMAPDKDGMRYVIIRSRDSGVCAGYLAEECGDGVELLESRRLWYWKGAASLHQLANEGVKCPNECKFPAVLAGSHYIKGVCEILDVTTKAQKSIAGVPVWEV